MKNNASHYRIGIFVIASIIVLVAFVLFFGSGTVFEREIIMETYFDDSVQGLYVGSPVKQRGVQIGKVKKILFVDLKYQLDPDSPRFLKYSSYVVVTMAFDPSVQRGRTPNEARLMLERQIDDGLRVRLATQDLTGNMYIELDYVDPKLFPSIEFDWVPDNIYIPSAPSLLSRLADSVETVFARLEEMNIESVVSNADQLLQTINTTVQNTQADKAVAELRTLVDELRQTNSSLQKYLTNPALETVPNDLSAMLSMGRKIMAESEQTLPRAIGRLNISLARFDNLLETQQHTLADIIENIRLITEDVKEITGNAGKYPSQVLFGDPPAQRQ
jgi:phospholipid/cholesterol/gamma-HCH transport system substrate-binding protein